MGNYNDAAIIEIVEDSRMVPGPGASGIMKPNQVRINGAPLWVPQGDPVTIHSIAVNGGPDDDEDLLKVTLTLFARRVFLGHLSESPETPERRLAAAQERVVAAQRELEKAQELAKSVA